MAKNSTPRWLKIPHPHIPVNKINHGHMLGIWIFIYVDGSIPICKL